MKNNDDTSLVETFDPRQEARAMALEAICRLAVWCLDAPTYAGRGLRATVMLYCVRPDLINDATLEEIGDFAGCTRQAVHKLANDFRLNMGLQP